MQEGEAVGDVGLLVVDLGKRHTSLGADKIFVSIIVVITAQRPKRLRPRHIILYLLYFIAHSHAHHQYTVFIITPTLLPLIVVQQSRSRQVIVIVLIQMQRNSLIVVVIISLL